MADASFLCHNARRFLDVATLPAVLNDHRVYYLAISIELSLKAYLRHAGLSDDQTRLMVRHNLVKGSELAAALGLDVPMTNCVPVLGRHYATGGFRRAASLQWPRLFVRAATSYALTLNDRVARCLG